MARWLRVNRSWWCKVKEVTTSVVCLCAFGGEHSSAECAASLARRHMELVKVASTLLA